MLSIANRSRGVVLWLILLGVLAPLAADVLAATDVPVSPGRVNDPPSESASWAVRVETLREAIVVGKSTPADADALYQDLIDALAEHRSRLRQAMAATRLSPSPGDVTREAAAEAQTDPTQTQPTTMLRNVYVELIELYEMRLKLLDMVSPNLRVQITGTGAYGVRELSAELDFINQVVQYQFMHSDDRRLLMQQIRHAPLPLVGQLMKLVLVLMVFWWWRTWTPALLSRMRARLMEIRPRGPQVVRGLKRLWYVDQLRSPVEWIVFFFALSTVADVPGLRFEEALVRIVVMWVLWGWFAVAFIRAVWTRGDVGLSGATAKIRLRSFWLMSIWGVLLGLALALTDYLVGAATLYNRVWGLFQVLMVPVLMIVLHWWRPEIFRLLAMEQEQSPALEAKLRRQTGLRGYLNAASGAAYLVTSMLRRALFEHAVGPGVGAPGSAAENEAELPESTRDLILGSQSDYPVFARVDLRAVVRRAQTGRGGTVAVIAERGVGKSAFLRRLTLELEGTALVLRCGHRGAAELEEQLATALGLQAGESGPEQISQRLAETGIRLVAIDDLHRLSRPVIGGRRELTRFVGLMKALSGELLWVVTMDRYAALVIRRGQLGRQLVDQVIELPPWTAEQISGLLDQRNEEAGLTPDFADLAVPRRYLDTAEDAAEDRNRAAVYSMIADLSGGNPKLALRTWLDCMRVNTAEGHMVVRLPTQPGDAELEDATADRLMVLRLIVHADTVSAAEIADSLGYPEADVSSILYFASARGWVEELPDGQYRLSWAWFRPVIRTLTRRNMLSSDLSGAML